MCKYSIIGLGFALIAVSILSPAFGDDCNVCGGSGELTCLSCGGSGEVNCPYCYGTSWIPCSKCYGSGLFAGEKCDICDGVGKIKCKRCEETGKVVCAGCGGSGVVKCPECSAGMGIAIGDDSENADTAADVTNDSVTGTDTTVDFIGTNDGHGITEDGDSTETTSTDVTGLDGMSVASTEWTAEYIANREQFDGYSVCELKDFVHERGFRVVDYEISPAAVDGHLDIHFSYGNDGSETIGEAVAVWEKLPGKDAGAGALLEVELGDKSYKRDGWTFTSYPDYYFWEYEGNWNKSRTRAFEWMSWKASLALTRSDLPGIVEKKAKKTDLMYRPKKKHINLIEPNSELYAFEAGDPRAKLWSYYFETAGINEPYIDRDGYYTPQGTVYWWHEKAGVFGSVDVLYVLGSYIISGEDAKSGYLGQVLAYAERVNKKNMLMFYKPDGYGGLYKVWEEEIDIEDIE